MMVWQRQAVDAGIRGVRELTRLADAVAKLADAVGQPAPAPAPDMLSHGVLRETAPYELQAAHGALSEGNVILVDLGNEHANFHELMYVEYAGNGRWNIHGAAGDSLLVESEGFISWVPILLSNG